MHRLLALALLAIIVATTLQASPAVGETSSAQASNNFGILKYTLKQLIALPNNTLTIVCNGGLESLTYDIGLSGETNVSLVGLVNASALVAYDGHTVRGVFQADIVGLGGLLGFTALNQHYRLLIDRVGNRAVVESGLFVENMFGARINFTSSGSGSVGPSGAVVRGVLSGVFTGVYAGLVSNESAIAGLVRLSTLSPNITILYEKINSTTSSGTNRVNLYIVYKAYYPLQQNTSIVHVNENATLIENGTLQVEASATIATGRIGSLGELISSLLSNTRIKTSTLPLENPLLYKVGVSDKTRVYMRINNTDIKIEVDNIVYNGSQKEFIQGIAKTLLALGASSNQKVILNCNGTSKTTTLVSLATESSPGRANTRGLILEENNTTSFTTQSTTQTQSQSLGTAGSPNNTRTIAVIIVVLIIAIGLAMAGRSSRQQ